VSTLPDWAYQIEVSAGLSSKRENADCTDRRQKSCHEAAVHHRLVLAPSISTA
jgi:hypothetical protein